MIPAFNVSGVLPPFTGETSVDPAGTSPYRTSIVEVVRRYCTSEARREILSGLLAYRARLRAVGIVNGFQWLDGSFVENVEIVRSRPPKDIDLVTFAYRPVQDINDWLRFLDEHQELFDSIRTSEMYKVDAYYVDLNIRPDLVVANTTYWHGLFSHQRETALWKGMLQVPISNDDDGARVILDQQDVQAGITDEVTTGAGGHAETA